MHTQFSQWYSNVHKKVHPGHVLNKKKTPHLLLLHIDTSILYLINKDILGCFVAV